MEVTFTTTVTAVTMSSASISCKIAGASSGSIRFCGFQVFRGTGYGGEQMAEFFVKHGVFTHCDLSGSSFSLQIDDCEQGMVLYLRPYVFAEDDYYGDTVMVKIKTDEDYAPKVSLLSVDSVTAKSAKFSAVVAAADPDFPITECGFLYEHKDGSRDPVSVKCTPDANGKITAQVNGLMVESQYFVKAYAICRVSGGSASTSFFTLGYKDLPSVSEPIISSLTMTSVSLTATVTVNNSLCKVTDAGFIYRDANGQGKTRLSCAPSSGGVIASSIVGLKPDTGYEVWAYVISESVERLKKSEFTTFGNDALPSVGISDFLSATSSKFSITGVVTTNHASYKPSEVGFILKRKVLGGTMSLDNGNTTREICTLSNGKFTLDKKNLAGGEYLVRAYLLSEGIDIYSNKSLEYSTNPLHCVPVVRLESPAKGTVSLTEDKKKQISISVSALIDMTYGSKVTAKGILYRRNSAPQSTDDGSTKVEIDGDYSSVVKFSIPDTGYEDWFFVAYATNGNGTGYSSPRQVRIWWRDGI